MTRGWSRDFLSASARTSDSKDTQPRQPQQDRAITLDYAKRRVTRRGEAIGPLGHESGLDHRFGRLRESSNSRTAISQGKTRGSRKRSSHTLAQWNRSHGPEGTDLLVELAVGSQPPEAGDDRPFRDVQSGTARDDDLHRSSSSSRFAFGNRRTFGEGANCSSCSPDDGGNRLGCARSGPDFRAGSKHQSW